MREMKRILHDVICSHMRMGNRKWVEHYLDMAIRFGCAFTQKEFEEMMKEWKG